MFAVIKSGGKQYKVAANDIIKVEKLAVEAGSKIDLDSVLMIGEGAKIDVGSPMLDGAIVTAEVLEQTRADKIIVFKKKRRQNYRRKKGHRQDLTVLKILEISRDGSKPAAKKAATKTAAKTTTKKAATKKTAAKSKAATKSSDDEEKS